MHDLRSTLYIIYYLLYLYYLYEAGGIKYSTIPVNYSEFYIIIYIHQLCSYLPFLKVKNNLKCKCFNYYLDPYYILHSLKIDCSSDDIL